MKRLTVNGISYALPFEHLLHPLTEQERAALAESIAVRGVISCVTVAVTPTWGRVLVDGMNRSQIAEPLELDIPVTNMGHITDEEARTLALSLNLDRRHSTPEQQQAARAGRISKTIALANDGHSVRVIAQTLSVSKSQVQRDLAAVPRGTVQRKKRPPAVRALANVTSLAGSLRAVLRDKARREALAAIAAQHGVPLDGSTWPLFETFRLVLRDLAQGGVSA